MGNPIKAVDPLNVTGLGGSSSGGSRTQSTVANYQPPDTSHLFDPYQKYIPQAMNSNQQITDPTAILQAYIQHMPEFRGAAEGSNGMIPPVQAVKNKKQGK